MSKTPVRASEFRLRKMVEFSQTDMAGIVHHTHFFLYMEEVEHAFLRSLGLSVVMSEGGRNLSWPRVSCAFDFKQPLYFEDEFDLRLVVERMGARSVTYRVEVTREGASIAVGHSTSVCCELLSPGKLRSVEIPAAYRERVQAEEMSGTP